MSDSNIQTPEHTSNVRRESKTMFCFPAGGVVPPDYGLDIIDTGDFLYKVERAFSVKVPAVGLTERELAVVTTYPDLIKLNPIIILGLLDAPMTTQWSSLAFDQETISVETLKRVAVKLLADPNVGIPTVEKFQAALIERFDKPSSNVSDPEAVVQDNKLPDADDDYEGAE